MLMNSSFFSGHFVVSYVISFPSHVVSKDQMRGKRAKVKGKDMVSVL